MKIIDNLVDATINKFYFANFTEDTNEITEGPIITMDDFNKALITDKRGFAEFKKQIKKRHGMLVKYLLYRIINLKDAKTLIAQTKASIPQLTNSRPETIIPIGNLNEEVYNLTFVSPIKQAYIFLLPSTISIDARVFNDNADIKLLKDELTKLVKKSNTDTTLDILVNEDFASGKNVQISVYPNLSENIKLTTDNSVSIKQNVNMDGWYNKDKNSKSSTQELTPILVAINTVGNDHFIKFEKLKPRTFTNKFTNLINAFNTKHGALTFPTTYDNINRYISEITGIITLYNDAKNISSSITTKNEDARKVELEKQKKKLNEVIKEKGEVDEVIGAINANNLGLITEYVIDDTKLSKLKNGVGGNRSPWQVSLEDLENLIFAESGVNTDAKTILQLNEEDEGRYDEKYAKLLNRGKLIKIADKMGTQQAKNAEKAFNNEFVVRYTPYYSNTRKQSPFGMVNLKKTFDDKHTYFNAESTYNGENYSIIKTKFVQARDEKEAIDIIINNYNTNFRGVKGFKPLKLNDKVIIDNFPQHYLEALYNEMKRLYQSTEKNKFTTILTLIKTHKDDLSDTEKAKYPDIVKLIGGSDVFNTHMNDLKTFFTGRKTVSELNPPIDFDLERTELPGVIMTANTIDSIKTGTFIPDKSTLDSLKALRKKRYFFSQAKNLLKDEKYLLSNLDKLIAYELTINVLKDANTYLNSSVLTDKGLYGDYNSLKILTQGGIDQEVKKIIEGKGFELHPYITALESRNNRLINTDEPPSYNVSTNLFSTIQGLMSNWRANLGNDDDKTTLEEVEALYKQFDKTIKTDLNSNWTINSDIKNATENLMYWNINDIFTKIQNLNPLSKIGVVDFTFYNYNTSKDVNKLLQQSLKDEINKLNAFIDVATTNVGEMNQTELNSFKEKRNTAYTNVVNLTYFFDSINSTILANIATRQNTLDKTRLESKYEKYKTLLNKLIETYPGSKKLKLGNEQYSEVANFDGNSNLEQMDIDVWNNMEKSLIKGYNSSESIMAAVDTLYTELNNVYSDSELNKVEYERVKADIVYWKDLIKTAEKDIDDAKQEATAATAKANADLAKLNEKITLKLDITTPFPSNTDDTQPTITSEIDLKEINGLYYKGIPDVKIFKKSVMNANGRGPPNRFKTPVKYWTQDTYGIEIKNTHTTNFSAKSIDDWLVITQEKEGKKYNVNLQINKMPYTAYKITLKPDFTLKTLPENNKNAIENSFSKGDPITNNPTLGSKLIFATYTGAVKSISDIIQSVSIETGYKLKYKIIWNAPTKKVSSRIEMTNIISEVNEEKKERIRGGFKLPEFLTRAGPTEEFVFGDYDNNKIVNIADDTVFYTAIKSANDISDSEWNKWLYKNPDLPVGKDKGQLNEVKNVNIRAEALNLNTARDETGNSYVDTWIKYGVKLFFTRYPELDSDGNVTGFAKEGKKFKLKIHPLCAYGAALEEWKANFVSTSEVKVVMSKVKEYQDNLRNRVEIRLEKVEVNKNPMGRITIKQVDPENQVKFFGAKLSLNKSIGSDDSVFIWKEATSKDEDIVIKDVHVDNTAESEKTVIAFVKYTSASGYDFDGILGEFKWTSNLDGLDFSSVADQTSTITVADESKTGAFKNVLAIGQGKTKQGAGSSKSRVDLVVVDSDKVAVILNSDEDISSFEINVYDDKDNGIQLSESTLTGDKSNDLNEVKRILDNNEIIHPELMPSTSVLKENPEEVSNESFRILATCLSDKSSFSKCVFCGILKVDTPNSEKTPDVDDVKIDFTIV